MCLHSVATASYRPRIIRVLSAITSVACAPAKVLILGGTGFVGSNFVKQMTAANLACSSTSRTEGTDLRDCDGRIAAPAAARDYHQLRDSHLGVFPA
jgi:hypothetical protein